MRCAPRRTSRNCRSRYVKSGRREEIAPAGRIHLKGRSFRCGHDRRMTMKTRKTFSAIAIVAVMGCSAAHAQVLGGNVGGALNGTLGGGLHDTSVLTNGNAN